MVLAGIQKNNLDTGLRRYDVGDLDTHLCGVVHSRAGRSPPHTASAGDWRLELGQGESVEIAFILE